MSHDSGEASRDRSGARDTSHTPVTALGRALPRVLFAGAVVLLGVVAYLLDARTHLRPLAAVTFASAAVVVIVLTELGVAYVGHLGASRRQRP